MKKEAKTYYSEICKLFPIHRKKEKQYLAELKDLINEFCEDDSQSSYDDYVNEFGTPIDIVTSYYQTLETKDLVKEANKKKIIKITCTIVIVLCFILICWRYYFYYQAYKDYQDALPSFKESDIIIIK